MKIGFFGGTFNPPHLGHIRALEAFNAQIKPDRLFVIPTFLPPLKQSYDISPAHRLEMCRLAFPFAEICDFEIQNGGVSYTYKTVEKLKNDFQNAELFMLIGTDQLAQLEKWKNFDYLKQNVTFAVAERYENKETFENEFERHIRLGVKLLKINLTHTDISSSEIRNGLSHHLLTPEIACYIKENNLYNE